MNQHLFTFSKSKEQNSGRPARRLHFPNYDLRPVVRYPVVRFANCVPILSFTPDTAHYSFTFQSFADLKPFLWIMYTAVACAVFSEIYIAITLCLLLYTSGASFKGTKSVVNVVMVYAINTGLICSAAVAVSFVLVSEIFN